MKKEMKDRLIIIACIVGSVVAAIDVIVAVVDLVLVNMGRETILF